MFFVTPTTTPGQSSAISPGFTSTRRARVRLAQWAVVLLLVLGGLGPLLAPYFRDLGQRPPYALYPLLLLAAGLLTISILGELDVSRIRPGNSWIAGALLTGSLLLLITGTATYVRWLAAPATLLAMAGLVWRLGGPLLARTLAPVAVLLLTIVPPPARGETILTVNLQRLSVAASSGLLEVFDVAHARTGNVLTVAGHRLLIEEACSGINSVIAVTAFTLLAGFWRRRPMLWTLALVPLALLFVIALNIARITGGAMLLAGPGIDLFSGTIHDWVGLIIFACGAGLVLAADAAIAALRPMRGQRIPSPIAATTASRAPSGMRLLAAFALAFPLVGTWSAWHLRDCWPAPRLPGNARFEMPAVVGEWTLQPPRVGERDADAAATIATHTRHWTFRNAQGQRVELAIAWPFTTWFHDPRVCYNAAGWSTGPIAPAATAADAYQFDMHRPDGPHVTVLFADFAERGHAQHPFERPSTGHWLARRIDLTRRAAFYEPTCEVQALIASDGSMTDAERASLGSLFIAVRESLREQVMRQAAGDR